MIREAQLQFRVSEPRTEREMTKSENMANSNYINVNGASEREGGKMELE